MAQFWHPTGVHCLPPLPPLAAELAAIDTNTQLGPRTDQGHHPRYSPWAADHPAHPARPAAVARRPGPFAGPPRLG